MTKTTLPASATFETIYNGKRFVKVAGGLIPNQGVSPYDSTDDASLIQNFWDWVARDPIRASVVAKDASLMVVR